MAPDQKGALQQGAWICVVDESGASLTPPVRRTWAPRGHTPILRHRMRGRKRLSMAAVCCYRPDGSDARLAFHLREGADDTDQLLPVVAALGRLVGGGWPVILVWDNLPAHTSSAMGPWLAGQHAWLTVEYLPAYAPDLNPVEGLWANLKGVELANRACGSLEELAEAAEQGVGRGEASPSCCLRSWTRQGFPCECHPILRASVAVSTHTERLTAPRLVGLALGFLGVVVLAAPWHYTGSSSSLLGVGASLLASACYAGSYVYARRFLSEGELSPLVLSSGQMIAGAALLVIFAPIIARDPVTLTPTVVAGVVILGVLGTGIAYVLNYRLIAEEGATAASTVTYLLPIVAVLLGLAVLSPRQANDVVGWGDVE